MQIFQICFSTPEFTGPTCDITIKNYRFGNIGLFLASSAAFPFWVCFNLSPTQYPSQKDEARWGKMRLRWGRGGGWDHVTPLSQSDSVLIFGLFWKRSEMRLDVFSRVRSRDPSQPIRFCPYFGLSWKRLKWG